MNIPGRDLKNQNELWRYLHTATRMDSLEGTNELQRGKGKQNDEHEYNQIEEYCISRKGKINGKRRTLRYSDERYSEEYFEKFLP